MSEAEKLRRNFARYLAPSYLKNPYEIAEICDKELDRSGTLLGYIRDEARALKSAQGNAAEVGSADKASTESGVRQLR